MKKLNFLVLATGSQKHLIDAITTYGHTYELHDPRSLYLYVSESENGYDRIYDGLASLDKPIRLKVKNYDAVISRIGAGLEYGANILTHLSENLKVYTTQTGEGLLLASNKLRTTMKLSAKGIRVPRTVGAYSPLHPEFLIDKVGGLPAVAKTLTGSQGKGVIILKDAEQTNTTFEAFWRAETPLKIQQYIEGGKKDVRAIVIGNKVVSAMERTGVKDFRANLSQGGKAIKVGISELNEKLCVSASQALGLDFSGVDMMIDENGVAYIIEVNGNPGAGIIGVTGHNHFFDLLDFIEKKLRTEEKLENVVYESFKELDDALLTKQDISEHQVCEAGRLALKEFYIRVTTQTEIKRFCTTSGHGSLMEIFYKNVYRTFLNFNPK